MNEVPYRGASVDSLQKELSEVKEKLQEERERANKLAGTVERLNGESMTIFVFVLAVAVAATAMTISLRVGWLWSAHRWPDKCEPVPSKPATVEVTTNPKALEQPR